MPSPSSYISLWFRAAAATTALFVLTIFICIAAVLGDENAPVARWLDRFGSLLLLVELIAIAVTTVVALLLDRRAHSAAITSAPAHSPSDSPPAPSVADTEKRS